MLKTLHDYTASAARTPFAYGQHDCALFAAGWVEAATGRDLSQGLRGTYRTMIGGLRKVRALGFADHVAVFAAALPERSGWMAAQPGDLAVLPGEDSPALGIVGSGIVYCLRSNGIVVVPLAHALRIFEVTHG